MTVQKKRKKMIDNLIEMHDFTGEKNRTFHRVHCRKPDLLYKWHVFTNASRYLLSPFLF